VIDRFLDKEVFLREKSKRQYLILIGASHLNHVADQLDLDKWELVNLCKSRFRISAETVADIPAKIEEQKKTIQL
jgi:hypothetical protein